MPTNETLMARIAGVCVLLSTAAEYACIGMGSRNDGFELLAPGSFGSAERLIQISAHSNWLAWVLVFGLVAPALTMVAWVAMYPVLKRGGSTAFAGAILSSLSMIFGIVAEGIRLALVTTLPPAYIASSAAAKPAVLALGAVLGKAFENIDFSNFVALFAFGVPLVAIAIVRGRQLPAWLGWSLLIPALLVGYIGAPLCWIGRPVGDAFMTTGMNLFFLFYVILGVLLLRWRPSPSW